MGVARLKFLSTAKAKKLVNKYKWNHALNNSNILGSTTKKVMLCTIKYTNILQSTVDFRCA